MRRNLESIPYRVGGLLYTPATREGLAKRIISRSVPGLTSIALCLEDSIKDECLPQAEKQLLKTMLELRDSGVPLDELPFVFVRIRTPEHMRKIVDILMGVEALPTGFIFPKFDASNAEEYLRILCECQPTRRTPLFGMPILESRLIADLGNRVAMLEEIKRVLDSSRDLILNVRVGGNDLSNMFGIRRSTSQTIYDIGVVRDILANIINVFGADYVVSGPVWEYFGQNADEDWAVGLKREIELDLLNGFVGKTVIHPSQLPIINDALKVYKADYEDAKSIISWATDTVAVARSYSGNRMNELKCHLKWAEKTLALAEIYGVREAV